MFHFGGFPFWSYGFTSESTALHRRGCPIRKSADIMLICSSPQLIAACHVLLRLLMPRHSPYALFRLNFLSSLSCLSFVNKYLLGFLFALKKLPFSLLLNLHLSVKLYFTHFFGKTYLISFKLIKSVLFYLFVLLFNILYSVFNEHI